jgi:hypothetical protein
VGSASDFCGLGPRTYFITMVLSPVSGWLLSAEFKFLTFLCGDWNPIPRVSHGAISVACVVGQESRFFL